MRFSKMNRLSDDNKRIIVGAAVVVVLALVIGVLLPGCERFSRDRSEIDEQRQGERQAVSERGKQADETDEEAWGSPEPAAGVATRGTEEGSREYARAADEEGFEATSERDEASASAGREEARSGAAEGSGWESKEASGEETGDEKAWGIGEKVASGEGEGAKESGARAGEQHAEGAAGRNKEAGMTKGEEEVGRGAKQSGGFAAASLLPPSTIKQVQRVLKRGGQYDGDIDGIAGPNTVQALRDFQRDHHLGARGHLDSATVRYMGVSLPGSAMQPVAGTTGNEGQSGKQGAEGRGQKKAGVKLKIVNLLPESTVAQLQMVLARENLYDGAVDGIAGPQTMAALARFQQNNGLDANKKLDPATVRMLGMTMPGYDHSAPSMGTPGIGTGGQRGSEAPTAIPDVPERLPGAPGGVPEDEREMDF